MTKQNIPASIKAASALLTMRVVNEDGDENATDAARFKRHYHTPQSMEGERHGRLTVTRDGKYRGNFWLWRCVCDCGGHTFACRQSLRRGNTKSCGCLRRETSGNRNLTHGMSNTRTFKIWNGVINRCTSKTSRRHHRYGSVIRVCERWLKFENFFADMGEAPPGLSLDRINNDGDYEPNNCRWTTHVVQCRNRSNNRLINYNGRTMSAAEWADVLGVKHRSILGRVRLGWSDDRIISTPIDTTRGQYDRSILMARRKKISWKEQIAATLRWSVGANGKPFLPPELRDKSASEILRAIEWDHIIPVAIGGTNDPWNLQPMLKADHRRKTSEIDIPQIAKTKRLAKSQLAHVGVMLAKAGQVEADKKADTPQRSSFAQGRKIRSAGFRKPDKESDRPQIKSAGFRKSTRVKIERFQP